MEEQMALPSSLLAGYNGVIAKIVSDAMDVAIKGMQERIRERAESALTDALRGIAEDIATDIVGDVSEIVAIEIVRALKERMENGKAEDV